MDTLPLELHQNIVSYCSMIDDGSTIRAIGSLSHYFRDIALPRLYDVIFVDDTPTRGALCSLAQTLAGKGSQAVHHLYISFTVSQADGSYGWEYVEALIAILRMASPSLRTLSLNLWDALSVKSRRESFKLRHALNDFLSNAAPLLREFSILTNCFSGSDNPIVLEAVQRNFPALERLHFSVPSIHFTASLFAAFKHVRCFRLSPCGSDEEERINMMMVVTWTRMQLKSSANGSDSLSTGTRVIVPMPLYGKPPTEELYDNGDKILRLSRVPGEYADVIGNDPKTMWLESLQGGPGWWPQAN